MKLLATTDFHRGEILLLNKPKTWSSFDVVNKIKFTTKAKTGHAGTLDPLATGLLIICTGKKTKIIDTIQGQTKVYEVIFRLGATTPSFDSEFPPENMCDASHITLEMTQSAVQKYIGNILQIPPVFSAVKVNGKRAYKSARKGRDIEMPPRSVTVHYWDIVTFESDPEDSRFKIVKGVISCSKGTYIRSLIHDLGQDLGTGAYIRELKRTAIGDYTLSDAWEIEDFIQAVKEMQKSSSAINE